MKHSSKLRRSQQYSVRLLVLFVSMSMSDVCEKQAGCTIIHKVTNISRIIYQAGLNKSISMQIQAAGVIGAELADMSISEMQDILHLSDVDAASLLRALDTSRSHENPQSVEDADSDHQQQRWLVNLASLQRFTGEQYNGQRRSLKAARPPCQISHRSPHITFLIVTLLLYFMNPALPPLSSAEYPNLFLRFLPAVHLPLLFSLSPDLRRSSFSWPACHRRAWA